MGAPALALALSLPFAAMAEPSAPTQISQPATFKVSRWGIAAGVVSLSLFAGALAANAHASSFHSCSPVSDCNYPKTEYADAVAPWHAATTAMAVSGAVLAVVSVGLFAFQF